MQDFISLKKACILHQPSALQWPTPQGCWDHFIASQQGEGLALAVGATGMPLFCNPVKAWPAGDKCYGWAIPGWVCPHNSFSCMINSPLFAVLLHWTRPFLFHHLKSSIQGWYRGAENLNCVSWAWVAMATTVMEECLLQEQDPNMSILKINNFGTQAFRHSYVSQRCLLQLFSTLELK